MRKNTLIGKIYIFIVICFIMALSGCDEVQIPGESTPTPTLDNTTIGITIDSEGFRK
ncbi:MAG: hypothetical protein JXJ04_14650 [Spirochaetales bacterium]|nr:hypothetical protein [Spirochaetales bacterium]